MLLFAYSLLYFKRKSDVSLVSQGSLKRAFLGQWRFSGLFSFCFPSYIWEVTVEQGLLTGSLESQGIWEKVKYGNLLLFKEKNIDGLELS